MPHTGRHMADMGFSIWHGIRHQLQGRTAHSLHSPFVFDWYQSVYRGPLSPEGAAVEALRRELTRSRTPIVDQDLGAGSRRGRPPHLGALVSRSARRRAAGELLRRHCLHYQPQRCLELGTNVGISALYQLSGLSHARFVTVEGAPQLADLARQHIIGRGYHAEIITGEFKAVLHQVCRPEDYQPDYVLLDGNHRYEATMAYADLLLPWMPPGSLMILDDIAWSREMARAWREVAARPEVSVSLELADMGICFLRRDQAKEHFVIR
ncbi:MAG: class I SAM-dependent methyltransferase [Bacteroidia bacterium]|nr:class I SAM-dependent methyltransferase [Bacteroidia bacterium]